MTFKIWCTLIAILLAATTLVCSAAPVPTASTDRVPTEDWTYDAMMHLASEGLIPGVPAVRFMGDWLYSREEMSGFVRDAVAAAWPEVSGQNRALLVRLVAEFLPELQMIGAQETMAAVEPFASVNEVVPTGSFEASISDTSDGTGIIGIYDATGIVASRRYLTGVATISDRRRKSDGDEFSRLEKVFVRGKTPNWEWEVGNDWMWWGPGYSGSMILSDNSPGFWMMKFGKDVNFGRRIGNIKITQFASTFEDLGTRFYFLGRRFEKRFSSKLHMGVSEVMKTSDRPNPLVLITPSFYLYQSFLSDASDVETNILLSIDALYKFSPRFEAYGELLIDDMQAPKGFYEGEPYNDPRQIGFLIGAHWPDLLKDGTTGLRAEYIFTDEPTYETSWDHLPAHGYTHDGFVIGHPVGPNSEAVFLRLDREIADGWTGIAEYLGRRPRSLEGANPNNTSRLSLRLFRELTPASSLSLRYDSLKLPEKEHRLQVGANYAF